MGTLPYIYIFLFFVNPVEGKKDENDDLRYIFLDNKNIVANLIANLSRMVLTTSKRLFYIKPLTRGFSINSHMYSICIICNIVINRCINNFMLNVYILLF